MSDVESTERNAALSVTSRRRLLDALASGPMDAAALAEAVGLHVTTARFHLDVLERAGMIHRATQRAGRPGRPRQIYTNNVASEPAHGYRQLAEVLTQALATDPDVSPRVAERAGRHWAQVQVATEEDLSWEDATRRVEEVFQQVGFAPRLVDVTATRRLELDACPFRDLARTYPEIVCTVHLGLLRGSLDRLGIATADEAGLRPFVTPELCVAELPIPRDNG